MMRVALAGTFPASLEEPVRRHLTATCEVVVSDEAGILAQLAEIDVLVTMALTAEMGRASTRLKLVQVPGAGLDRINRSAVPDGVWLANVYVGTRRELPNT
jgi:phosphoglycerate dehydrogenase-like enzyme